MLGRQHSQAWRQEDDLPGKDTEFTFTTLLGICATWESDNADDVSSLDVLVLLLKGNVGLGLLQLAHDLDCDTLCLA